MSDEKLNPGGLMRCCTETWNDTMIEWRDVHSKPPKDGDTIQCKYGKSSDHRMIRKDGVWRWDHE